MIPRFRHVPVEKDFIQVLMVIAFQVLFQKLNVLRVNIIHLNKAALIVHLDVLNVKKLINVLPALKLVMFLKGENVFLCVVIILFKEVNNVMMET